MSKRTFTKLVWKEVSYPRPFDEEKICEILSHISSLIHDVNSEMGSYQGESLPVGSEVI